MAEPIISITTPKERATFEVNDTPYDYKLSSEVGIGTIKRINLMVQRWKAFWDSEEDADDSLISNIEGEIEDALAAVVSGELSDELRALSSQQKISLVDGFFLQPEDTIRSERSRNSSDSTAEASETG